MAYISARVRGCKKVARHALNERNMDILVVILELFEAYTVLFGGKHECRENHGAYLQVGSMSLIIQIIDLKTLSGIDRRELK